MNEGELVDLESAFSESEEEGEIQIHDDLAHGVVPMGDAAGAGGGAAGEESRDPRKRQKVEGGENVEGEKPGGGEAVKLRYIPGGMELNKDEADRIRAVDMQRLLASKKLLLILDLDHTVLNSSKIVDVPEEAGKKLVEGLSRQVGAGPEAAGTEQLFHLPHIGMWTKLRPFTHEFLRGAAELFEMYIYTMGESGYATEMASILDPTGKLFDGRIISRSDSSTKGAKDLDVVLGADSTVVILDDTEGVWPRHQKNIVKVDRYHYFPSSVQAFRLKHKALLDMNVDESNSGGLLAAMLRVLREVHGRFYDAQGDSLGEEGEIVTDIRRVIEAVRSEVLEGVTICFSRVFPSTERRPERHPLWTLATALGAVCQTTLGPETTHVVAADKSTDKARRALVEGKHVVSPRWLECCGHFWRREKEDQYKAPSSSRGGVTPPPAPEDDTNLAIRAAGGGGGATGIL